MDEFALLRLTDESQLLLRQREQETVGKTYAWLLETRTWQTLQVLPDSAVMAYAFISAAARGRRKLQWVMLHQDVRHSRSRHWWSRAVGHLVHAGLIAVDRKPGRVSRYRLLPVALR